MKKLVGIIDYGSGNTASMANSLLRLGHDVVLSGDQCELMKCSHLVLPGVGSFGGARKKLEATLGAELLTSLRRARPFLGVCVGMQLLAHSSSEFGTSEVGLNFIPGEITKIKDAPYLPHVGWNSLIFEPGASDLLKGISPHDNFYFVHSFAYSKIQEKLVVARAEYGSLFPAIVESNNVYGVQFHPEKSGRVGDVILRNFLKT
jgi:glutamine amidotransferase